MTPWLDRRRFLFLSSGAVLGAGLLGCSGDDGDDAAERRHDDRRRRGLGRRGAGRAGLGRPDGRSRVPGPRRRLPRPRHLRRPLVEPGGHRRPPHPGRARSRLRVGRRRGHASTSLADVFTKIDEWQDTRDFDLMYLIWLLSLGQGDTPTTTARARGARGHRGPAWSTTATATTTRCPADRVDNLWYWSENHLIIGHTIEYLAGAPPARRHVHRHRAHRAPSTPSGPGPTSSTWVGERAGARLLRVALATSTCSRTSRRCSCSPS